MKLFTVTVKIEGEDANGKPKARKEHYLTSCVDIDEALEIVKEEFKGMGEQWSIIKVVPSIITAVLNYGGKRKVTDSSKVAETLLT